MGNTKQHMSYPWNYLLLNWGDEQGSSDPLQYSCLENPMDRRARRATVHRVAKSQTHLKRLSTHTLLSMVGPCAPCVTYMLGGWDPLPQTRIGWVFKRTVSVRTPLWHFPLPSLWFSAETLFSWVSLPLRLWHSVAVGTHMKLPVEISAWCEWPVVKSWSSGKLLKGSGRKAVVCRLLLLCKQIWPLESNWMVWFTLFLSSLLFAFLVKCCLKKTNG